VDGVDGGATGEVAFGGEADGVEAEGLTGGEGEAVGGGQGVGLVGPLEVDGGVGIVEDDPFGPAGLIGDEGRRAA